MNASAGDEGERATIDIVWIDDAGDTDARGEDLILGRPGTAWRAEGRAALGLRPASSSSPAPLIVTGHQPGPWHPGILAKYALLGALRRAGADGLDLLVEHDVGAPLTADFPVRATTGRLETHRLTWTVVPEDRAWCTLAPAAIRRPAVTGIAVAAAERLDAWRDALVAAGGEQDHVAGQVRAALAATLPAAVRPPRTWSGSMDLLSTPLARALLEEMVRDPWACAAAYARALRRVPDVQLPPLHVRDDFVELPLWRLDAAGRRRRADDVDVAAWLEGGPDAPRLAPRALMLTAIARLGLGDVFIHGRGGAAYDRVMAAWVTEWLGARPAPAVLASADLRLDLGVGRATRAAAARRDERRVTAHRVWHDPEPPRPSSAVAARDQRSGQEPGLELERGPGPVKRELLAAIDAAPRKSKARRLAWRRMHRQLEAMRGVHVGRVESACRRADESGRAADAVAVAARRDWFALLYEPSHLDAMAERVAAAPVARDLAAMISAGPSAAPSAGPSTPTVAADPSA